MYFRMETDKENYFRDLEDVIQHLKKEVIREEVLNAKVSSSLSFANQMSNKMHFSIVYLLKHYFITISPVGLNCQRRRIRLYYIQ